jgi:acetyltransferase-like isoleucine patch superfamily enzyme
VRKIIKRIIIFFANKNLTVHNFYEQSTFIRMPVGLLIINYIVQRLLQLNGDVRISVNFTSRVTAYRNITHYHDKNTLLSFAVSGGLYIQAINGIQLGRNLLIAPGVKIISANHDAEQKDKSILGKPIRIGDNVWIGANAIILPQVEIGSNCIVGAGAVVTKSFLEEKLVIAGNPAKIIRRL